jgi:hypothetical protein
VRHADHTVNFTEMSGSAAGAWFVPAPACQSAMDRGYGFGLIKLTHTANVRPEGLPGDSTG